MNPVVILIAAMAIVFLVVLGVFAKYIGIWLRALLAGANVPPMTILGMVLRRSPVSKIIDLKIMATQAGLNIPVSRIESAALQGADVERAVLALIRAKETGVEVTWEEVISHDVDERLREKLMRD